MKLGKLIIILVIILITNAVFTRRSRKNHKKARRVLKREEDGKKATQQSGKKEVIPEALNEQIAQSTSGLTDHNLVSNNKRDKLLVDAALYKILQDVKDVSFTDLDGCLKSLSKSTKAEAFNSLVDLAKSGPKTNSERFAKSIESCGVVKTKLNNALTSQVTDISKTVNSLLKQAKFRKLYKKFLRKK